MPLGPGSQARAAGGAKLAPVLNHLTSFADSQVEDQRMEMAMRLSRVLAVCISALASVSIATNASGEDRINSGSDQHHRSSESDPYIPPPAIMQFDPEGNLISPALGGAENTRAQRSNPGLQTRGLIRRPIGSNR